MSKILDKIIRQVIIEATGETLINMTNSDTKILNTRISKASNKIISLVSKYGIVFEITSNKVLTFDQIKDEVATYEKGKNSQYNKPEYAYIIGTNIIRKDLFHLKRVFKKHHAFILILKRDVNPTIFSTSAVSKGVVFSGSAPEAAAQIYDAASLPSDITLPTELQQILKPTEKQKTIIDKLIDIIKTKDEPILEPIKTKDEPILDPIKTKDQEELKDDPVGKHPFRNTEEGNAFRLWVNTKYPAYAKKEKLDKTGKLNSFVDRAWALYGKEYTELKLYKQLEPVVINQDEKKKKDAEEAKKKKAAEEAKKKKDAEEAKKKKDNEEKVVDDDKKLIPIDIIYKHTNIAKEKLNKFDILYLEAWAKAIQNKIFHFRIAKGKAGVKNGAVIRTKTGDTLLAYDPYMVNHFGKETGAGAKQPNGTRRYSVPFRGFKGPNKNSGNREFNTGTNKPALGPVKALKWDGKILWFYCPDLSSRFKWVLAKQTYPAGSSADNKNYDNVKTPAEKIELWKKLVKKFGIKSEAVVAILKYSKKNKAGSRGSLLFPPQIDAINKKYGATTFKTFTDNGGLDYLQGKSATKKPIGGNLGR